MKKIALLLALALALSCCLFTLAACGDGEESSAPADSSAATSSDKGTSSAATSSEKEETSAEASSEPVESSEPDEETSEPEESSEPEKNPDATPNPDNKNLALDKPYVKSMLHQQGGQEVNWAWDDNAPITYPDTDDAELTDGEFPPEDAKYDDPAFMGFAAGSKDYDSNGGYSYLTIDLGEIYEISRLVAYVGTSMLGAGLNVPAGVEFLVSEDGETFTSVGKVVPQDDASVPYVAVEQTCDVTGQYVQIRLTGAGWMHICEAEVY